jgi:hypothetical protein
MKTKFLIILGAIVLGTTVPAYSTIPGTSGTKPSRTILPFPDPSLGPIPAPDLYSWADNLDPPATGTTNPKTPAQIMKEIIEQEQAGE